ncbi:MAG: ferredoxin [Bacteroidetes bacterium]|jgi:hypothetical protein|nr:ferredoxin [Bacteroidota bacterium]MBT7040147.1 ferredoxin [Bacteroidota bacterium]MBT7826822.1 ferredoxin [Bacteroidota bacterium]
MDGNKGNCICIRCDKKYVHKKGIPCKQEVCPDCGKKMIRENSYHHQLYLKKKEDKNENSHTK